MDPRLRKLIESYIAAVARAVSLLEQAGIPRPATASDWAVSNIPWSGTLHGAVQYRKHGYGCSVGTASSDVDFDFGEQGQIDGFDHMRLESYAECLGLDFFGFSSNAELENAFKEAEREGHIRRSRYILYYLNEAEPTVINSGGTPQNH